MWKSLEADTVAAAVKEKRAAWKCWQNGGSENAYLHAKKAAESGIRC